MAQLNDRLAANGDTTTDRPTSEVRRDGVVSPLLSDALTWSATLDPHDDTREIEITDEMVCLAIAQMEGEQVYPFRREAGTPPPVARPVAKAEVIAFPRGDAPPRVGPLAVRRAPRDGAGSEAR